MWNLSWLSLVNKIRKTVWGKKISGKPSEKKSTIFEFALILIDRSLESSDTVPSNSEIGINPCKNDWAPSWNKFKQKIICCWQGWGQVKYSYLVLDTKSRVLGTYLYLTLWNSKVCGTYLYLKAKYLILVQVLSSTFVKLTYIFRLKFGICFL